MNDRQKKQYAKALKRAEEMGGYCLSKEYTMAKDKMLWKCSNPEHPAWEATFNCVVGKYKSWCPVCNVGWSATIERAAEKAAEHDGYCLSEYCASSRSILEWKCSNPDHLSWKAKYNNVVCSGIWCPVCNVGWPATIERAQDKAAEYDGYCLSEYCASVRSVLEWKCSNPDHPPWKATYNDVVNGGGWCPVCNVGWPATIERARERATEHDGYCLSEACHNALDLLEWKCNNPTHPSWQALFLNVVNGQSWCPICGHGWPATIERARERAARYDGYCLSEYCEGYYDKLIWKCSVSHHSPWTAVYGDVVRKVGSWCPECSISKAQTKLLNILRNILEDCAETIRPDWLKSPETGHNLEIDIYLPKLKIAIEYNGEQHYRKVNWSGKMTDVEMKENLQKIQHRDRLKKQLISQNPRHVKHFVIFTYEDEITEQAVRQKLIKEGVLKCDST